MGGAEDRVSLHAIIATVQRWHDWVQRQAQLARDIGHLREAARMLFEDKPDKTKAVEAVNDIAAKRQAAMDGEARALFDSIPALRGSGIAHDPGERLRWLMCVNQPGLFPYTQGIAAAEAPDTAADTGSARAIVLDSKALNAGDSAVQHLAECLAEGWHRLAEAQASGDDIDAQALQIAIAFDEYRDATHRALAAAVRRVWAVSLREHFGVKGEGLRLVLVPQRSVEAAASIDDRAVDRAEGVLLAALQKRGANAPGVSASG